MIKYRLDISNQFENFDYQYFSHLCDASHSEQRLKAMGYTVKIQFYDNGQWV